MKFQTCLRANKQSWAEIYIDFNENGIKDKKRRKRTYTVQGFYIFCGAIKYSL